MQFCKNKNGSVDYLQQGPWLQNHQALLQVPVRLHVLTKLMNLSQLKTSLYYAWEDR